MVWSVLTEAEADEGIAILDQAISEVEEGKIGDDMLGDYAGW